MSELPAPFIVGVGRSGTTLLRLMLDAHPDLAIPAETHFLGGINQDIEDAEQFSAFVTQTDTWPNLGIPAATFRAALHAVKPFSKSDATRLIYRLYSQRFGKQRWGDKTPPYRGEMLHIRQLLPEAHFIHLIRDGRDIALSYRELWFGPGEDVEEQARFWVTEIVQARNQSLSLSKYLELRYETLVLRAEESLQGLCDYLALPYYPNMLDYFRTAADRLAEYVSPFGDIKTRPADAERFRAIHWRTRMAPDASRIGRWRTEMPEADQRRYERIAGSLLKELGYETRFS